MKIIKKYKIIIIITSLLFLLIGSNISWYLFYQKQNSRVKNSLIPSLTDDYYNNQIALTKYVKYYEEYASAIIYNSNPNYPEIKDVPLINQNPTYPNGCEAASATMLLNYYGINITLEEFISYLPKNEVYIKKGTRFGPDPSKYYAGDPTSENKGWGCFDLVIARTIKQILEERGSNLQAFLNYDKKPINHAISDTPCLLWVTTDYEETTEIFTWLSYDKKTTYTYPKNEHVVVLTGSYDKYYYDNDPLKRETNIPIEKEKLEKCFDSLGRQYIHLIV